MRRRELRLSVALLFISLMMVLYNQPSAARARQRETGKAPENIANRSALKNWVYLCAPCHSVKATGTDNGPALLGPNAKRKFTRDQLMEILADPEAHGLSEALPAFRKLVGAKREEMAAWFAALKSPDDIVVDSLNLIPPPFVFVQNCSGCHGPDATGGAGPNLHKIYTRRNRETIMELIYDPKRCGIKSNIMPSFPELSQEDRAQIADWLVTLDE
jgi:cytochrome c553